nr:MAG TPA: hypothetical protein [Caudoviricetes sp.]
MIPAQFCLFCPGLSDLIYLIRPRPIWSDLVGLYCPILLIDPFFSHLSMKNFIFLKKFIWVWSAAVGFARQILYNNRAFQGYYIIYIFFTSFYIFLLLFILFFASFFSFSHFLSFCL